MSSSDGTATGNPRARPARGQHHAHIDRYRILPNRTAVARTQEVVTTSILRALERASRQVGPAIGAPLADLELTEPEIHVLARLDDRGPVPIGDLRRGLGLHRSTLTSVLDRLVDRGLVDRYPHPADRRSTLVGPTPAGRRAAERAGQAIRAVEAAVLARVDEADLAGFDRVVAAIDAALGGRGR